MNIPRFNEGFGEQSKRNKQQDHWDAARYPQYEAPDALLSVEYVGAESVFFIAIGFE